MQTSLAGAKLQCSAPRVQQRTARRAVVVASANQKATGFAAAALAAALLVNVPAAHADLTEDLLAKTAQNKALNDKKRLASSYSNFERSRSVTSGTCSFPNNWFGCDIGAVAPASPITADIKLECEGKEPGKCASNMNIQNRNT